MSHLTPRTTIALIAAGLLAAGGVGFLLGRSADAGPPETDGPVVLDGDDPLVPVYVEDSVDEFGIPIPVGPQHEKVWGGVTAGWSDEPAPFKEADYVLMPDGSKCYGTFPVPLNGAADPAAGADANDR